MGIEARPALHLSKSQDAHVCKDKEYNKYQSPDVQEGWQGDDKGCEEDLDGLEDLKHTPEPQDPEQTFYAEDMQGPEDGGVHEVHAQVDDARDDDDQVELVPATPPAGCMNV